MFCINLETDDPFFNLAIEEILLKNGKEDYLLLYINSPSVIIGKHQSGHREVNTEFVTKNNIPVIRRISGGGTVYHDPGNLNFSFIKQCESGRQVDFIKYTLPVIAFLKSMGINAKYEGKNDLRVGGLKISGNAEHVHGNRVLHHGTLLFNTSLETLRKCIRKDTSHYSSRGVMSNSASVTNLDILLKCFADISDFKSEMLNYFIQNTDGAVPYELAQAEITEADRMALSKYQTWEWNWAYGPEYTFSNIFKMNEKQYSCKLHIKDGIIRECNIDGSDSINIAAGKLIGYRHMVKDLSEAFRNENIFLTEQEVYNFF